MNLNGVNPIEYYAHTCPGKVEQRLIDHLQNVSKYAEILGSDAGVSEFATLAGYLHDLGKYSESFQKRLLGEGPKVDHSTAGGQLITQLKLPNLNPLIQTMLAYCIFGHHAGLADYGSVVDLPGDSTLQGRLKKSVPDYNAYRSELSFTNFQFPVKLHLRALHGKTPFSFSFFTRMVFSVLVDADFLETESYVSGNSRRGNFPNLQELLPAFEKYMATFADKPGKLNSIRQKLFQDAIAISTYPKGFFTMTIPTGGGKTLASMGFALHHAIQNQLKRIIYIIPYTSIIEQNASLFKNIFGIENVLEQHSNFDWEDLRQSDGSTNSDLSDIADDATNSLMRKMQLSSENWDVPIIVTTNVQFFESLFSNRSSRCRKLHNIANSVLIFDEAQMLPRSFLEPCMLAVNELVQNYGCTSVFCTATQPNLEGFFPGVTFTELAQNPPRLYNQLKRVTCHDLGSITDEELAKQIVAHDQVLCIVNTRKHAHTLFNLIPNEHAYHLSTHMYPQHRSVVIRQIRHALQEGEPCRVISTQLLEAGVDLDFPIGFREIAGLDSIIQSAGRVNREGKFNESPLFVFQSGKTLSKGIPAAIRQAAAVTQSVFLKNSGKDLLGLDAISAYYQLLYDVQSKEAFDLERILECFIKKGMRDAEFDFRTAAERFKLIDQNTRSLIIPFDTIVKDLLYREDSDLTNKGLARSLQRYSVNIFEYEYLALSEKAAINVEREVFTILNNPDLYYDQNEGLIVPSRSQSNGIFIE
jgi:CRISPR-associated endonuclease/helicase Cas3